MLRSRHLLVTVLLVLCPLAACASGSEPAATSAPRPTDDRCSDLVLLGARGQGQTLNNVGGEVQATATALAEELPSDVTVRLEGIDYDAEKTRSDATYAKNVRAGARMLSDRHLELAEKCPGTTFGFIGFSVGAEVVHRAVVDPVAPESIAVVAMIGDPIRNPDDPIEHFSYGTPEPQEPGSVGRGEPVAPSLRDRTISFCVADDEVCAAAERGRSLVQSPLHKHFYEKPDHVRQTARAMADVVEQALP